MGACVSFVFCGHRVYVHCTAGLGRAPAVCIAYVHWFGDHHNELSLDLDAGMLSGVGSLCVQYSSVYATCVVCLWSSQACLVVRAAYKYVTDIRPCGPKKDAIRGATFGELWLLHVILQ